MAAITEDKAEYTQVVPIEQYEPSMLRALFDRQAAGMVPVDIHIEAQGAEQRYSTQGLTAFRDAAAAWPWDTLLRRLGLLCGEIQNNPLLIGESLRVFAEDRIFWDEAAGQWRFLLLATEGAAWAGLSDHRPQALWQALLQAAQEANPQAAPLLGQAIGFTGQGAFSISSLRQLLSDLAEEQPPEPASEPAPAPEPEPVPEPESLSAPAADAGEPEPVPPEETQPEEAVSQPPEEAQPAEEEAAQVTEENPEDLALSINELFDQEGFFASEELETSISKESAHGASLSEDGQVSGPLPADINLIDPESEDMEYRPWESGQVLHQSGGPEIGVTGEPAGTAAAMEKLQDFPEQPRMPGREPPPPPTVDQPRIEGREPPPPPKPTRLNSTDNLGKTTVLGQAPQDEAPPPQACTVSSGIPRIVRKRTNELAYVDRSTFVIGSKRGGVDFLVQNNPAISRRHAAIITRQGSYFLKDMGSSNGVFLQGQRLQRNKETPLTPGTSFILADEEFTFQC